MDDGSKETYGKFLSMCEIHLVEHDDVMVRLFLQTLIGQAYEWYMSLPVNQFHHLMI
jgi:hypothetical protein